MMRKIKWGIVGLGKIAHKFAEGLARVPDAELYAVASRDLEKARGFSEIHDTQIAYGSYEDLLEDEHVEVVYIATPHVFHHELTTEFLHHGKAVLCEKPFAMNVLEAREMVKLAREKKIFLMEALWTRFLPHYEFVLKVINSGEFGKVRSIRADFGFPATFDKEKRLFNKSLGGGSLLDIGIYPVFLAYTILGIPDKILATAEFAETGVDASCEICFLYPNAARADLVSTFMKKTPTTAEIQMDYASIHINSRFHEPSSIRIKSKGKDEVIDFGVEGPGYEFEAAHVTKMLQSGKTESNIWDLDKTLDLMYLLDKVRVEIELNY